MKLWKQDKGHNSEIASFVEAVSGGTPFPMNLRELWEVTMASFAAARLRTGNFESLAMPEDLRSSSP